MNSLLQQHGCANVFRVPEGLKELMSDISREVLRDQPENILEYITNYLSALLITREHGVLAVKILEELCDCKPTLEESLVEVGIAEGEAKECAEIIQEHFESFKPVEGDKIKEKTILKKLLCVVELNVDQAAAVCKIMQEVFRDYWQKRMALEETISKNVNEPWEKAAQRTIDIYKVTNPTFEELVQAAQKIQAAYRGYHTRREMMKGLKVKTCQVESTTTTLDVAESRQINLGPKMDAPSEEKMEVVLEVFHHEEETTEEEHKVEREASSMKTPSVVVKTPSVAKMSSPVVSAEKKPPESKPPTAAPSAEKMIKTVSVIKEEVSEDQGESEDELEYASRSEGDGTSEQTAAGVVSSAVSEFDDTEAEDSDGQTEDEG